MTVGILLHGSCEYGAAAAEQQSKGEIFRQVEAPPFQPVQLATLVDRCPRATAGSTR